MITITTMINRIAMDPYQKPATTKRNKFLNYGLYGVLLLVTGVWVLLQFSGHLISFTKHKFK